VFLTALLLAVAIGRTLAGASLPPNPPSSVSPVSPSGSDLPPNIDETTWLWILRGLFIALIVVGLAWCFAGYRLFKILLFLAGFVLFFFICLEVLSNQVKQLAFWISLLISVGAGIAGGVLMILVIKIGFFVVGFLAGSFSACCLIAFTPLSTLIASNVENAVTIWVTLACIVGAGIVVGVVAVFLTKHVIIVSSAITGAIMIGAGVDFLADLKLFGFVNALFSGHVPRNIIGLNITRDWPVWLLLFGIVAFAVGGAIVQYRVSAKEYSHEQKPRGEEEYPLLIQNN